MVDVCRAGCEDDQELGLHVSQSFERQGERIHTSPRFSAGFSDPGLAAARDASPEPPLPVLLGDISGLITETAHPHVIPSVAPHGTAVRSASLPALSVFDPEDRVAAQGVATPTDSTASVKTESSPYHGGTLRPPDHDCATGRVYRTFSSPEATVTSPVPVSPVCDKLQRATITSPLATSISTTPLWDALQSDFSPNQIDADDIFVQTALSHTTRGESTYRDIMAYSRDSPVTGDDDYTNLPRPHSFTWPSTVQGDTSVDYPLSSASTLTPALGESQQRVTDLISQDNAPALIDISSLGDISSAIDPLIEVSGTQLLQVDDIADLDNFDSDLDIVISKLLDTNATVTPDTTTEWWYWK